MALLAEKKAHDAGLEPIPGDPGLPWIGRTMAIATGKWMTDDSLYEQYGEVYYSRALGKTVVAAAGPDAAAEVLLNKDKAFGNGPGWSFFIGPFFERGLMLLDGEEHHRHRRIMQEAFVRPRLEGYLAAMQSTIAAAVAGWGPGRMRFLPAVRALGLDIAVRTFMGLPAGPEARAMMRDFAACVNAGTAAVRYPVPGTRWAQGLRARQRLEHYLTPHVARARGEDGDSLLHALCHVTDEEGSAFTDRDVVDHMIFLLMAAHDTSTTTLTTMAYQLARHPEWQQRCREESLALGTDTPSYDELGELTSLDLVMRESMRVVSPVPGLARMAVRDTHLRGHFVPRGALVNVPIQHLHNRPELWPDPSRFDPGRFSEERREDRVHRYAFLPFGGGVHKCIGMYFGGMEITSVMHRMLLDLAWSVPDGYTMPIDWHALPKPQDGLPLRLERRSAKGRR